MRRYWLAFIAVVAVSFSVLGWVGVRIYQMAPPIPAQVVTTAGDVIVARDQISYGQNVWQAMGGMQVGSIWGHGSYVAPDWSADWLHRESMFVLEEWATRRGRSFDGLPEPDKAGLIAQLKIMMRRNTYDESTGTLTIEPVRARAYAANAGHFSGIFRDGKDEYAIPEGAQSDPEKLAALMAFFFWSSWAATTERPNDVVTYTSNWPHEPLVGNTITPDSLVWTGVSILLLLAGIGAMAFWHAAQKSEALDEVLPTSDPLLATAPTKSQLATIKYFWTVTALILVQIMLGVVVAHYGVEGNAFYGVQIASVLPYSVARTWHTQLGVLWIATAWLAAGLYIAPAVGGREPAGQRAGVNVLFVALLVVVVGSMLGQWLSVMNRLGVGDAWFYFGHSGYEYIELGRAFQIGLFVGLLLWFWLVARAIWPALQRRDEQRPILTLFLISAGAIASFYAAALAYGRHTNLAVAEYWRWWVVHLWVEGFFEVFATVVIAFLFAKLGLVRLATAGRSTVLAATIFLSGGIIGTLHHLYFSGTPTFVLALGAVFSALEVVPLMFVGFEAWENLRLSRAKPWIENYKWPIYCFVAVAFWNLVGAGLFGFMINPPVALYYMQGLNTTPVHGHTALFGVYGMLGIGLMLFCLRSARPGLAWRERAIASAFWLINGGLLSMVLLSVLPVGLLQTQAAVRHGYWYARSAEFLQTGVMDTLRWMRVVGDTAFALGAVILALFIVGLATGRSYRSRPNATGSTSPVSSPAE
jgi:nitric oxide reductase subunit B